MLEQRAYKESFVLLRTTFEKFLYFWLMFEGKRFRWTDTYNIRPKISKTPKEARDRTIALRTEKKNGNPKLKDVLQIQPGSLDHEINVTFEQTGLFERRDRNRSGDQVPIYNFILRMYNDQGQ
jgi:hypothetical protein